MNKQCSKCKETKDETEFYKHSRKKDGFSSQCKACESVSVKSWRQKKRKNAAIQMDGNKLCKRCGETKPVTKFHVCSIHSDGRKSVCADCTRDKVKETYLSDLEGSRKKAREYAIKYREMSPLKHLFGVAKRRARDKGQEFTITMDDLDLPEACPVLGIPLCTTNHGGFRDDSPSIDRIDNSKGYIPGNVIVVSTRANVLKRDATLEEMKKIVEFLERHADI